MSTNYFRSKLRKFGKGKDKRNKSTSSLSQPEPSSLPHAILPRHESSYSLCSTASGSYLSTPTSSHREDHLERREVINITGDVQNFVAAVTELKKAIKEHKGSNTSNEVLVNMDGAGEDHDMITIRLRLKELIQIVLNCLDHYQGMHSTDIKNAATSLISSFQKPQWDTCNSAIDTLVTAFTRSVHMFLGGEGPEPFQLKPHTQATLSKGLSKSHENLTLWSSSYGEHANESIVQKIDQALTSMENSVELATQYLQMRTKYHRYIASYLWRRGQIEMRYHQEMLKLARKTHSAVTELKQQEDCLPLADLFLESVDQDMRFASNCNTTYNIQVGSKVVQPLEHEIAENEKATKELIQTWHKELRKLSDAKTGMKSAKAKYDAVCEELEKVKNLLSAEPYGKQAEKRKRELMDLEFRWQEAEIIYKQAVSLCNSCQYQVHKSSQQSILCACRRFVLDLDHSLKLKLETYFKLQHNLFLPIPDVMNHCLSNIAQNEVGRDFMDFIRRQPTVTAKPEDFLFEEFARSKKQDYEEPSSECSPIEPFHAAGLDTNAPSLSTAGTPPYHAWVCADRESPHHTPMKRDNRRPKSAACLFEANDDVPKSDSLRRYSEQQLLQPKCNPSEKVTLSKSALIHSFVKLQIPSRCRECDNYVYFNGFECEMCGLACHKKCLAVLSITCGKKPLDRKLTIFGVDFLRHLEMSRTNIPIIVTMCINEIEKKGLSSQGLYRISSAKTKLEHLCQLFESGSNRVDLSDKQPHLIASCLKFYFRQLPEPIFTFSLYDDVVSLARESMEVLPCNMTAESYERRESAIIFLEKLRDMLSVLDHQRYLTLARLFYHLKRVTNAVYVKKNAMPASNLGIVFGPTLLRTRDDTPSLTLLADMTAQAKAIEILISHVNEVFTVSEEEILDIECLDADLEPITEERLIDGGPNPHDAGASQYATVTPCRTPFATPPQQRRENIGQLGEVLDELLSAFPECSSPLESQPDTPEWYQSRRDDTFYQSPLKLNEAPTEVHRLPHSTNFLHSSSSTESCMEANIEAQDMYTEDDISGDADSCMQECEEKLFENNDLLSAIHSSQSSYAHTKGGAFSKESEKSEELQLTHEHGSVSVSNLVRVSHETETIFKYHNQDLTTESVSCRKSVIPKSPVSPWHDKSRKKRINPLRVLNAQTFSWAPTPLEKNPKDYVTPNIRDHPKDYVTPNIPDHRRIKHSRSCDLCEIRERSFSSESLHSVSDDILC